MPSFRPFAFLLAFALLAPAAAAPLYSVRALGAGTSANGINNAGQVVGDYFDGASSQAFVWAGGALTPLGTMGGRSSTARAVGSSGVVAGYAVFDDDSAQAFLYDGGAVIPLGTLGGASSFGLGVNGAGQVVGQSLNSLQQFRAFSYAGGAMSDLGVIAGGVSLAQGVNNAGQVVGETTVDDEPVPTFRAFLYQDGVMNELGTLGGRLSSAAAINEAGQVTGYALGAASPEHAFLYTGGVMIDLGTLGGGRSFGYGINALGQVVGASELDGLFDSHAFLYSGGVMTDLNSLIDPALGWTLFEARGINDQGQIAAFGCLGGECQAVLLDVIPSVPEPGSAWLLLAGLGLLALRVSAASRRA